MYLGEIEKEMALWRISRSDEFRDMPLSVLWKMRGLLKHEKFSEVDGRIVINSFLPPFPGMAFARLGKGIRALARGEVIPLSAYVAVTSACRYNCWHCSKAFRSGQDMSAATIQKLIKDLQDLGVCIIGFTGGEPLMREDLEDIVRGVDERASTILFTSGDGLTDERCRALKTSGLFGVAVSLDHYEAGIHDERRGKNGAFEAAVRAIRIARKNNLYTMIQLVATREMADQTVFRKYLGLAERLGVHEIRLLEPMPTGQLVDCDGKCMLDEPEREELRRLHVRTNRSRHLPKVCSFAHIESGQLYGCGAGFQHIYVDAQGNVCPCDFTPVSFGNVSEENLQVIWKRMREAFCRPRRTCFLMENREKLKDAFAGRLPLAYSEVKGRCDFGAGGGLPEYYRLLGWKDNAA